MVEPQNQFKLFWAIQLVAYLIAVKMPDPTWALRGIPAAQASLVGLWLAVGPIRPTTRVFGAVFFVALFGFVATTLMVDPNFGGWLGIVNGWELLLLTVRPGVVGSFYWFVFLRRGYALTNSTDPPTDSLLRFRLLHVFILTTFVALYFAVHRSLDSGLLYSVMLVVFIIFLGTLFAAVPLLTSLAILEPNRSTRHNIVYLTGILVVAALIAAQTYDSMSNWLMVGRTLLQLLVEVGWLAGSLVVPRRRGLRLAKLPDATTTGEPSTQTSSRAEYLKLTAKAFAVTAVLLVIWVGWSIYRVEKRQDLRTLLDGCSTPSGTMAFITRADGSAAAPRAVKERVALFVSQVLDIRNHGGTVFAPTNYADPNFIRHWLGDEGVAWILVDAQQDIPQIRRAFPEAMIAVLPPPQPSAPQQPAGQPTP